MFPLLRVDIEKTQELVMYYSKVRLHVAEPWVDPHKVGHSMMQNIHLLLFDIIVSLGLPAESRARPKPLLPLIAAAEEDLSGRHFLHEFPCMIDMVWISIAHFLVQNLEDVLVECWVSQLEFP